ncbi:MAG TPA: hypothetical protein VH253_16975 [Phycisphaerae bacterium]|nr:hypothetical protein [Phycisphaerae bacterium]
MAMRALICLACAGLCATAVAVAAMGQSPLTISPQPAPPAPATGTEIVAHFYELLLQDSSPEVADEEQVFDLSGVQALRPQLLKAGFGHDTGAAFFDFLRHHKELFLPRKDRITAGGRVVPARNFVQLTTSFRYERSVGNPEPKQGDTTYVIAQFPEDADAVPPTMVTVFFPIVDGKIEFDAINWQKAQWASPLANLLKAANAPATQPKP